MATSAYCVFRLLWLRLMRRKCTDAKALFQEKLADGGRNAGAAEIVAEALKKELKVLVDEEILKAYTENSDFAVFITEFLSGKPFWLVSQKA